MPGSVAGALIASQQVQQASGAVTAGQLLSAYAVALVVTGLAIWWIERT